MRSQSKNKPTAQSAGKRGWLTRDWFPFAWVFCCCFFFLQSRMTFDTQVEIAIMWLFSVSYCCKSLFMVFYFISANVGDQWCLFPDVCPAALSSCCLCKVTRDFTRFCVAKWTKLCFLYDISYLRGRYWIVALEPPRDLRKYLIMWRNFHWVSKAS